MRLKENLKSRYLDEYLKIIEWTNDTELWRCQKNPNKKRLNHWFIAIRKNKIIFTKQRKYHET